MFDSMPLIADALIGKLVIVKECHSLRHGDRHVGCVCALRGQKVVIESRHENGEWPSSFCYHISGSPKLVRRSELAL